MTRTQQIVEQAGFITKNNKNGWQCIEQDAQVKRLIDLLVKECAWVALCNEADPFYAIKNHFK
jgi:hypothetical protein